MLQRHSGFGRWGKAMLALQLVETSTSDVTAPHATYQRMLVPHLGLFVRYVPASSADCSLFTSSCMLRADTRKREAWSPLARSTTKSDRSARDRHQGRRNPTNSRISISLEHAGRYFATLQTRSHSATNNALQARLGCTVRKQNFDRTTTRNNRTITDWIVFLHCSVAGAE